MHDMYRPGKFADSTFQVPFPLNLQPSFSSWISFQYLISPHLLMQLIETDGAQHGR